MLFFANLRVLCGLVELPHDSLRDRPHLALYILTGSSFLTEFLKQLFDRQDPEGLRLRAQERPPRKTTGACVQDGLG
jgi:hypothetical protein